MRGKLFDILEREIRLGWVLGLLTLGIAGSAAISSIHAWMDTVARAAEDARERAIPVVTMQGELITVTGSSAIIHVWGVKHRDCSYRGIQAYSVDPNGTLHEALAIRIDTQETNRTKPVGVYDIGEWSIGPLVENAIAVHMYVTHMCGKTDVITQIASVPVVQARPQSMVPGAYREWLDET